MKQIRKIQPKTNNEIDLDILAQRIRDESQKKNIVAPTINNSELVEPELDDQIEPKTETKAKNLAKNRTITKNEESKIALPKKKAGRKKTNTDEMHRFAIDLPQWLFDKIKAEADENFSTVRGQIIKLLLARYKS